MTNTPIDTKEINKFTESEIINYYQIHHALNDRFTWTTKKLKLFSISLSNQINYTSYHRNPKTDLILLTELRLAKYLLIVQNLQHSICNVVIDIIKQPLGFNYSIKYDDLIKSQIQRFPKQANVEIPIVAFNEIMHKANANFNSLILESIVNTNVNPRTLIAKLRLQTNWRRCYRNLKISQRICCDREKINVVLNSFKSDVIDVQQNITNRLFTLYFKKQSFEVVKNSLALLFNLKLITAEDLLYYYNHKLTQFYDESLYLSYQCEFKHGKNQHYYHELKLSKKLSQDLHCPRKRPFSLNFYFQLLKNLDRFKEA